METGCYFSSGFGQTNNDLDLIAWAEVFGFEPGPYDRDTEFLSDIAFDAESFLNQHVAEPGHSFGWFNGDFFYSTDDDWADNE